MPVIAPRIAEYLNKRYCNAYNAYGYCVSRSSSNHHWYLFFLLFIPLFFLLFCCFRRRNFARRRQGTQPMPYTGWTTYQYGNQQQQTYQQPYYENTKPESEGYNNTSTNVPPPAYNPDQTYERPDGPPPQSNNTNNNVPLDYQSPQAPSNAYYRT